MKIRLSNNLIVNERLVVLCIVACALLVRIALVMSFETYIISDSQDHWAFGYEMGRVASAIANGNGFSSPFEPGNMPTAWLAPVYPYFLALIFKFFGTYSQGAAFAALFMNSLFSSLTCGFVYYIGKAAMNRNAGLLSSVIFALYPPSIWHSINNIWNTTLAAMVFSALILYVINYSGSLNFRRSVTSGVVMGIAVLTSPAILAFYPFLLIWLYFQGEGSLKCKTKSIGVILILFILSISPWMIRNYLEFDKLILIKSNLGLELRLGNNPNATGSFEMRKGESLHPTLSDKEMARFKEMGEIDYTEYCLKEAMQFIYENPLKFLSLSGKKVYMFWLGDVYKKNNWMGNIKTLGNISVLKAVFYLLPLPFVIVGIIMALRNNIDISLLLILFISYPVAYYFTHVSNRYRHPLEPFIIIIGSYGCMALYQNISQTITYYRGDRSGQRK